MGVSNKSPELREVERQDLLAQAVNQASRHGRVTVPRAAALLDISAQTLRKMIKGGLIQTVPVGCRDFVTLAEIERQKKFGNRDPEKDAKIADDYGYT